MIDTISPLEEDDLVAWHFDSNPNTILFGTWWGPTGRDLHGRFVEKGSPREAFRLDQLAYTAECKVTILGKVFAARPTA